jgi:RimJ/RimL family protein N-acetyltransferase
MQINLIGKATILSSVTMEDSGFIAGLRSMPNTNKFLSNEGNISIEQQNKWLTNFLQTNNAHYFIITDNKTKNKTGTISLYDINEDERKAEFGRYICINNVNAIESELMLLKFAFNILNLKEVYCRTVEENINVWNQHYNYGFEDNGFEILDGEKKLKLRKQKITFDRFKSCDYQRIINIIDKFSP